MLDVAVEPTSPWPDIAPDDWDNSLSRAVAAAFAVTPHAGHAESAITIEVAVRLTDDGEVHALNSTWRGKDKPTNVLSFPQMDAQELDALAKCADGPECLLGDIILARETCERESAEKAMNLQEYASHLVVHATLHLLGYDHEQDDAACAMESLECRAMALLGYDDPYRSDRV